MATGPVPVASVHATTTVGPYLGVGNGDVQRFGGLIDEPMVFRRALSAAEIRSIYNAGSSGLCGLGLVVGANEPVSTARSLEFAAPRPNPTSRLTTLVFQLPGATAVWAEVFDIVGRRVATLIGGQSLPAGEHRTTWDGRDVAGRRVSAGIYQIRVVAGGALAVRKVAIVE